MKRNFFVFFAGIYLCLSAFAFGAVEASLSASVTTDNSVKLSIQATGYDGVVLLYEFGGPITTTVESAFLVKAFQILSDINIEYEAPFDFEERYFFLRVATGNADDFEPTISDGEPADNTKLELLEFYVPGAIMDKQTVSLYAFGYAETGLPLAPNKCFNLFLGDDDGIEITNKYALTPSLVCINDPETNLPVQIQIADNLTNAQLWLVEVDQPHGLTAAAAPKSKPPQKASPKKPPEFAYSPDFGYPLAPEVGTVRLTGTFGEYPGHANVHPGTDLGAASGKVVVASKNGKITRTSRDDDFPDEVERVGGILKINHGNGEATHYLHINTSLTLTKGDIVTKGQPIGTVGDFEDLPGPKPHLHFEIFKRGQNVNPVDYIPQLSQGDVHNPVVNNIVFRSQSPFSNGVTDRDIPVDLNGKRVFAEIILWDQDERGNTHSPSHLAPRRMEIAPEGGPSVILDFKDQNTVKLFDRNPFSAGGIASIDKSDKDNRKIRCPYWFEWNTSAYSQSKGPHSFTVTASDHNNNALDGGQPFVFKVGPKFEDLLTPLTVPERGKKESSFKMHFFCGPFPQGTDNDLLDKVYFEAQITNAEDWWLDPVRPEMTEIKQNDQIVELACTLQTRVKSPKDSVLTISAKSLFFPGIFDEVQVQVKACSQIYATKASYEALDPVLFEKKVCQPDGTSTIQQVGVRELSDAQNEFGSESYTIASYPFYIPNPPTDPFFPVWAWTQGTNFHYGFKVNSSALLVTVGNHPVTVALNGMVLGTAVTKGNDLGIRALGPAGRNNAFRVHLQNGKNTIVFRRGNDGDRFPDTISYSYLSDAGLGADAWINVGVGENATASSNFIWP